VDYSPHGEAIQVVLGSRLLRAVDRAAHRTKLNRSALVRNALREHLRRLEVRELEERDRKGYQISPQDGQELSGWELQAAWPGE
jgi:metal-responsive CopG/Arc/MetJ family transcriptional regulator